MERDQLYELVYEAAQQAVMDQQGGHNIRLSRRMLAGSVVFRDAEGRVVKEVETVQLFRKVTAVREKLRVLEQKINNHPGLEPVDQAELQGYITRCYGSLTTFNFLFQEEDDRFRGTGGR